MRRGTARPPEAPDGACLGRAAPLGRAARPARARRPRPDEPARAPRLLRVHPGLQHVRRRARRPDRRGARHRCRLVDVRRRSEPARAGRARLVQELDRISTEAEGILVSGGSAANITALACARESLVGAGSDRAVAYVADQTHSSVARAARLIGFRPDQLRVLPTDERPPASPGCARRRGGGGQAGRPPAPDRRRQRGSDQHRCRRPAARARRLLPRAGHVAARRRGLWRVRLAVGARSPGSGRDRASRLRDPRPSQVAVPADRVRVRAGARGAAAQGGVHHKSRLSRRLQERRGELRRSRASAHARRAGAEDLALDQPLRPGRLPAGRRPRHRSGARWRNSVSRSRRRSS